MAAQSELSHEANAQVVDRMQTLFVPFAFKDFKQFKHIKQFMHLSIVCNEYRLGSPEATGSVPLFRVSIERLNEGLP